MSGDHLERLEALLSHLEEISRHAERSRPGDHRTKSQITADFMRQSVDPNKLRGDLRAAVDELKRLRAVRTCGQAAVLPNGDEHVCVLPFGHGPEHRDRNGTRWQVHDAPPESDDALKQMLRMQGLTLPVSQQAWFNGDAAPQQPAPDGGAT